MNSVPKCSLHDQSLRLCFQTSTSCCYIKFYVVMVTFYSGEHNFHHQLMFLPRWVILWQIHLYYSLSSHIHISSPFVCVFSLVLYPLLDTLLQNICFDFFQFQFCNAGHRYSIIHWSVKFNFHNHSASSSMLSMAGLCVRCYTIWHT
jgi:hypothetical protein